MAEESQKRSTRACDVSGICPSARPHTNESRHAKRELVDLYPDSYPDLVSLGNASNARMSRTGRTGNIAVRDVEKLANIACLKLLFVEGSHFMVQRLCATRDLRRLGLSADNRGPAIGYKRKRQLTGSTEHVHEVRLSSSSPARISNSSPHIPVAPINPYSAQTATSSLLPSPDSSLPTSRTDNPKSSGNHDAPLLGLPRPMVDELLAAYFTHVHVGVLLDMADTLADQVERLASDIQACIYTLQCLTSSSMFHAGNIRLRIPSFDC